MFSILGNSSKKKRNTQIYRIFFTLTFSLSNLFLAICYLFLNVRTVSSDSSVSLYDRQLFDQSSSVILNPDTSDPSIVLSSLETMRDLAHDIKFGQDVLEQPLCDQLFVLMDGKDYPNTIRSMSSVVLASALSNNFIAQKKALEMNIMPKIVNTLRQENHPVTLLKKLFLLSKSVQSFPLSEAFISKDLGSAILLQLYDFWSRNSHIDIPSAFQEKLLSRLSIIFENIARSLENVNFSKASKVIPIEWVFSTWCSIFQKYLMNNWHLRSISTLEVLLNTVSTIQSVSESCPEVNFYEWLNDKNLAYKNKLIYQDPDLATEFNLIIKEALSLPWPKKYNI
ncbi:nucleotide exchange factor for the ER lumenal Hsp70 chaperone, Sil1 [Schizosaccharomyces pombe]|uniref:Uncharacterized protein C1071.03c n=1 Tax=Schizosaccharomyces pombe (strain 972 / ATCC 24843) TaxID=284812 RepID=YL33_SCHPO|nr:uncharacterized protein SPAC1071.03c [Schizosaccharomyces pombe]Q9UTR0.1 RecName: Full=Uncharacterized protein C1071.03c [Schizosaccharomyces pombe 972h-]CAB59879.1 sequence orphan [Schizosaccharomyces pombe]|eukprot:NP_594353.1 uncharacterized protein SPAC1071.03c [Schizosaccharomyces pombe]